MELQGRVQPSLQSPGEQPCATSQPGADSPTTGTPVLPGSIRELQLLQPLRRSTSFTRAVLDPLQSRVLHTSWPRRWLPRRRWLRLYRLGGWPASQPYLPEHCPAFQEELLLTGLGRGRQPCLDLPDRQTDPFPQCRVAGGRIFGYRSASGVFCVDLVVFHLAFGGDGEPRALIWMTDHINSDSFAPIPGT